MKSDVFVDSQPKSYSYIMQIVIFCCKIKVKKIIIFDGIEEVSMLKGTK